MLVDGDGSLFSLLCDFFMTLVVFFLFHDPTIVEDGNEEWISLLEWIFLLNFSRCSTCFIVSNPTFFLLVFFLFQKYRFTGGFVVGSYKIWHSKLMILLSLDPHEN